MYFQQGTSERYHLQMDEIRHFGLEVKIAVLGSSSNGISGWTSSQLLDVYRLSVDGESSFLRKIWKLVPLPSSESIWISP